MKTNAHKLGLVLSGIHAILLFGMVMAIEYSTSPQAPLSWALFAIIDFPVSLLYFFSRYYSLYLRDACCGIAFLFYPPYFIHGILGTIWWYLLPRLIMPSHRGGIWRKRN